MPLLGWHGSPTQVEPLRWSPRTRGDRRLVTLLYVAFAPAIFLAYAFHASYGPGCSISPANGFLITPNDTLDVAGNVTYFAVAGVLTTIAGLRSVPRWRAATPLARRSLAPVYVTRWLLAGAVAVWCGSGVGLIFTDTVLWQVRVGMLPQLMAIAAAGGILIVFLRSSVAHGAAGRLARELDTSPLRPGSWRTPCARHSGTPTPDCCSATRPERRGSTRMAPPRHRPKGVPSPPSEA
jgi:hypothetical protein